MADWSTISALATGGGTLVLALATFASVRSSNRTARIAEQSLLIGVRPLLMPSRLEDAPFRVFWSDEHEGGQRVISRFSLAYSERSEWDVGVAHHWNVDRDDPRPRD